MKSRGGPPLPTPERLQWLQAQDQGGRLFFFYKELNMAEPRLLLIQGPPGSGKDAFGALLAKLIPNALVRKFARVLKDRCHALFGMPNVQHYGFDAMKDQPVAEFMGLTPRQAYIWLSEKCMKPKFGDDVFGRILLANLKEEKSNAIFVVTDSGFRVEAEPLIKHFGADRCLIVQMERKGHDFSIDSRNYWDHGSLAEPVIIQNNGNLDDLGLLAEAFVRTFYPSLGEQESYDGAVCLPPRPGSSR